MWLITRNLVRDFIIRISSSNGPWAMWPIKPMRDPKKFYKHWVWKVNEAWLKSIKMPAQTRLDGSC
jgi:hypothetical protein